MSSLGRTPAGKQPLLTLLRSLVIWFATALKMRSKLELVIRMISCGCERATVSNSHLKQKYPSDCSRNSASPSISSPDMKWESEKLTTPVSWVLRTKSFTFEHQKPRRRPASSWMYFLQCEDHQLIFGQRSARISG